MANGEKKKRVVKNQENLIPLSKRTKEEQREIQSKGGKASAAARKQIKDMRELARILLAMDVPKSQDTMRANMKALGFKDEEMNHANAVLTAMLLQASNGDVNAAKFIRDTAGFTPEENVNVNADVTEKPRVMIYLPEIEKDEDEDEGEGKDA